MAPRVHANMISGAEGRRAAICDGVRIIPEPIELPRETAIPNVIPRIRSRFPFADRGSCGVTFAPALAINLSCAAFVGEAAHPISSKAKRKVRRGPTGRTHTLGAFVSTARERSLKERVAEQRIADASLRAEAILMDVLDHFDFRHGDQAFVHNLIEEGN